MQPSQFPQIRNGNKEINHTETNPFKILHVDKNKKCILEVFNCNRAEIEYAIYVR